MSKYIVFQGPQKDYLSKFARFCLGTGKAVTLVSNSGKIRVLQKEEQLSSLDETYLVAGSRCEIEL